MWSVSNDYLTAMMQGGLPVILKCQCITPTGTTALSVVNDSAAVQATFNSTMGRTAALVVERATIDAGLLNPLTDHMMINVSLLGWPDIPLGYFRPLDYTDTEKGHVAVRFIDITQDLANHDFTTAWTTSPGGTYSDEMKRIVHDASSLININTTMMPSGILPQLTWTNDHASALNDLTAGVSATWQADRIGGLVAYLSPYAVNPAPAPSLILRQGVGGVQVKVSHTLSNAQTRNGVTIIVTNQDGSVDQRVFVYDNEPTSLTRWGGPFGQRNKTFRVQSLPSNTNVLTLATRLLRQLISTSETWIIDVPFLPIIDQGDFITVQYQGAYYAVIVETISYTISATTTTTLTCRRYRFSDSSILGVAI